MFESLNGNGYGKGNRFWTTVAGAAVMSLCVAVLILIPLVYHQDISMSDFRPFIVAPPRSQYVSQPDLPAAGAIRTISVPFNRDAVQFPTTMQTRAADAPVEPPPGIFIPGSLPGDVSSGVPMFGLPDGGARFAPPPPPSTDQPAQPDIPEQPEPTIRIRVGGYVQAARLVSQPRTPYPPLARQMRVQGTVRLEAVINMDGTVKDVRVLSGPPLLVQAALDSVSQWRYQPTLLNGEPVEVITTIELNFTLAR